MFRTNATRTTLAVLTVSAFALTFASGCVNEVSGPSSAAAPVASQPISWTPEEMASKAGVATLSTVPGDLTGDGYVDASDLAAFAFLMRADVTHDERIDSSDEAVLAAILTGGVPDLAQPAHLIDASDYAAFAAARARADLTMDGHVDISDLVFFNWMRARGDLDGDGVVSRRDRNVIVPEVKP
jgi:hypothetical protein